MTRLLTTGELLSAMERRLRRATRVDVAVAWVTHCDVMPLLQSAAKRGVKVRFIAGLSGNSTDPTALRYLQNFAEVKISQYQGTFHPKFYCFEQKAQTIAWVGSANCTSGGFSTNEELVCEFDDGEGKARQWFENLWGALPADCDVIIADYEENWTRSPPRGRGGHSHQAPQEPLPERTIEAIRNWPEFVTKVEVADEYFRGAGCDFSVLGEEWSYVETIAAGHNLILQSSWRDLSKADARVLLGFSEVGGAWGLLGTTRSGIANSVFLSSTGEARRIREKIRMALLPLLEAENEQKFIELSTRAIGMISSFYGFSSGIATRLIALTRPDRGIALNGGSAAGLSELTGLPRTPSALGSERNYCRLLQWLYQQPWYDVPRPVEQPKRTIWNMRAALLDALVYRP